MAVDRLLLSFDILYIVFVDPCPCFDFEGLHPLASDDSPLLGFELSALCLIEGVITLQ